MKRILLTKCLILLLYSQSFTQNHKAIFGKIEYKSTLRQSLYLPGTDDRVTNLTVYFSDTSSAYLINNNITSDAVIKKMNLKDPKSQSEVIKKVLPDLMKRLKPTIYFHKIGSNVFINSWFDPNNKPYCIVDTISEYSWVLLPDTTRILGFFCQKAECKASVTDGVMRTYTAWYTPEIPIPFGPSKFYGLPGLILEINEKYYNFKVKEIKLDLAEDERINLKCCNEINSISKKKANEINEKQKEDLLNIKSLNSN